MFYGIIILIINNTLEGPMAKKQSVHYIDNKAFLQSLIDYKLSCVEAVDKEQQAPVIPDDIGAAFIKIAQRLSNRPNFVNYAFKEEMIADGIENCVQYAHNFDPAKSKNPFAYFTQIIYFAFVRRIQKEKKQLYIKYKTIQQSNMLSDHIATNKEETTSYDVKQLTEEQQANMYEFIKNFEIGQKKKYSKKPAPAANTLAPFVAETK
jgi:hypothetical protein